MRRSEVASEAAEYQRVIDGLAAAALAAAAEVPVSDSDHGVKELSLRLDLLPSMLRYAISSHTGIEQHVQYQSLERMLLQAFGLEKIMPPERYQNLVEFEATLRSQFGDSIIRMLHGQGWAADPTSSDKMEPHANAAAVDLSNPVAFIAKHNSGLHSSGHCSRSLPAADFKGGASLHNLLNFFEAARARGKAVTFSPPGVSGSVVIAYCRSRSTRNPKPNATCNPHFERNPKPNL
jgi:hypothetical protein